MRILFLYDWVYPDHPGGIEKRNFDLARELERRKHDVTLAGFVRFPDKLDGSMRVLNLGAGGDLYDVSGRRRLREAWRYRRAVSRLDIASFDVVETAGLPFLHLGPLNDLCKKAAVPLLVSWYEFWGRYWKSYRGGPFWRFYAAYEQWAARRFGDVLLGSSDLVCRRLEEIEGRSAERIPVGVDVEGVRRVSQGAKPGAELLSIGRLIPEKRFDLVIRALPQLRLQLPQTSLCIIGEGPDRGRLEALGAELGVADAIQWAGRVATEQEVWRSLGAAQVLIHPSAREGFGIVVIEAMAAGLPVVCCESSENASLELISEGVNGRITTPSPSALAQTIASMLRDRVLLQEMSEAARCTAKCYAWPPIAEQFEAVAKRAIPSCRS